MHIIKKHQKNNCNYFLLIILQSSMHFVVLFRIIRVLIITDWIIKKTDIY